MRRCNHCGKEYPDYTTVCPTDEQPLLAVTSTGVPATEAGPGSAVSPPPPVAPEPGVPPPRSELARLFGNRLTWLIILALAWSLVLLGVVPSPRTSYYGKPPVESAGFTAFFPLIAPMGLFPDGFGMGLIGTLVLALLLIVGFWGSFIWFMIRLKVLKESALFVISLAYLLFIALSLAAWAVKNQGIHQFDL